MGWLMAEPKSSDVAVPKIYVDFYFASQYYRAHYKLSFMKYLTYLKTLYKEVVARAALTSSWDWHEVMDSRNNMW